MPAKRTRLGARMGDLTGLVVSPGESRTSVRPRVLSRRSASSSDGAWTVWPQLASGILARGSVDLAALAVELTHWESATSARISGRDAPGVSCSCWRR